MQMSTDKGLRHNEGKVKVELIPPRWILALAEVLTKGAEKYEERNWEKGMEWSKCYSAAQRHLLAFWDGEDLDKETGLPHVAHAAWNCLALLTYSEEHQEDDNRPVTKSRSTLTTVPPRKRAQLPSPEATAGTHELKVVDCGDAYAHGGHATNSGNWCGGHSFDRT